MILAIILLVMLGLSMLYNLGNFAERLLQPTAKYSHVSGPRLEEVVCEDNDSPNKIAVIEVRGLIMSQSLDQSGYGIVEVLHAQLDRAKEDDRVKAVLLKIDSPGGEVLASDEIYRAITEFQEKTGKPVVGSMGGLAASGGYYVSAPCRWIVANPLTITGSIGVILHSYNYRGLMDKVGLRPEVYKSGRFKDMLSGSREPDEIPAQEREMVQSLIDETYGRFKEVVSEGRRRAFEKNQKSGSKGVKLDSEWESYADGRVLSGSEAFRLGFVDELGNFEDAVTRTKKIVGIREANLVQYQQRFDLADFFRIFGKSQSPVMKVDLGLDAPRLQAGQLYFLSPTLAH